MNAYLIPGLIERRQKPNPTEYLQKASEKLGISIDDLRGPNRSHELVAARAAIANRMFIRCQSTSITMGKALNRDHATILHYKNHFGSSPSLKKYLRILINSDL